MLFALFDLYSHSIALTFESHFLMVESYFGEKGNFLITLVVHYKYNEVYNEHVRTRELAGVLVHFELCISLYRTIFYYESVLVQFLKVAVWIIDNE